MKKLIVIRFAQVNENDTFITDLGARQVRFLVERIFDSLTRESTRVLTSYLSRAYLTTLGLTLKGDFSFEIDARLRKMAKKAPTEVMNDFWNDVKRDWNKQEVLVIVAHLAFTQRFPKIVLREHPEVVPTGKIPSPLDYGDALIIDFEEGSMVHLHNSQRE